MFDLSQISKALFIENEDWASMKHNTIGRIHEKLVEKGIACTVIDNATNRKQEVFTAASTTDIIFFASTFIYKDEVKNVGNLLKAIKSPKVIMGYPMNQSGFIAAIEDIWTPYELVEFAHHRLFEIENSHFDWDPTEGMEWCKEIDLNEYVKEVHRLEEERIKKNAGYKRFKTKVLIKKIQAVGPQWSNLKEGDIVDELDCLEIDDCPQRGIWVMGKTEPVKLLNDSGYDEWEYVEPNCYDLADEFFSRGAANSEKNHDLKKLIGDYIGKCTGSLKMTDAELWDFCDQLCSNIGVERRGNRHYFERRLQEHRKRFVYFKDPMCVGSLSL